MASRKSGFPVVGMVAFVLLLLAWGTERVKSELGTPAGVLPPQAQVAHPPQDTRWEPGAASGLTSSLLYGVNFISSAEAPSDEQQYQNGLATGATWNRWPIYWPVVEQEAGAFDWTTQDATVQADVAHGLQLNAILLGTPWFYQTGTAGREVADPASRPGGQLFLYAPETATPQGLYDPVFDDGTDVPGPGKGINPANVWARFVHAAVNRYKPGGTLAQLHDWPAGVGITHWEMWNEPELASFWDGTLADYARLLKVGYLAAKQADTEAQVLFGALANFQQPTFYDDVLTLYDGDPLAASYDYFHDVVATHNYLVSERSFTYVRRAADTLAVRGLSKPIWLNEMGVPAWNDYPGPVWDPNSPLRARMDEQADFLVQSALYATYAGADAVFHFQLYDACGNQPAGTDFPPHNGELCDANGNLITDPNFPCAGDANGLFRNPADAVCFTQHPQPETPRPNFDAFRVLTTYFQDVEPLWWLRPGGDDGPQEWIAFYRPGAGQRIVGLWSRVGSDQTAVVPALDATATLLTPDGITQTLTATNGAYTLTLPAATNQNAFWDPDLYPIGGRPYLLLETDAAAPAVTITAPPFGGIHIFLAWSGDDGLGGGMMDYSVSVAVDGGPFTPWLTNTTATNGVYATEPERVYTFRVSGRDRAGNVSPSVEASVPTLLLDETISLPLIFR